MSIPTAYTTAGTAALPATRALDRLAALLSLWIIGFWRIERQVVTAPAYRRSTTGPAGPGAASTPAAARADDLSRATLILANHASYVDVLLLARAYAPAFFQAASEPTPDDQIVGRLITPTQAALHALAPLPRLSPRHPDAVPLAGVLARQAALGQPVVLFPEGCASNGRGLLAADPGLTGPGLLAALEGEGAPSGGPAGAGGPLLPVGMLATRYGDFAPVVCAATDAPPCTVTGDDAGYATGRAAWHLLRHVAYACSFPRHEATVRLAPTADVHAQLAGAGPTAVLDRLMDQLARLAGQRRVRLGLHSRQVCAAYAADPRSVPAAALGNIRAVEEMQRARQQTAPGEGDAGLRDSGSQEPGGAAAATLADDAGSPSTASQLNRLRQLRGRRS
ncbi:hypothetical protein H696_05576 [Fonticula alba]|uniref:Phospholipid/glycerol acyltransferase domain-containing protein n=1 Tax=Fonticula alba TaxID=691883 RepID=A0A058Z0Q9_FONAL|nr:hypothetical protein H696_05576 [Fonticula alba]KCV67845.1 hypothetical protein H696_05576 [Fonticula alba]|eukprot:XP_009497665.1 hypothetical protein H696_05576 [Fonticula alba]